MSWTSQFLVGLALVAPTVVLARTDLSGCVSTSVAVSTAGTSHTNVVWYVPGTGEICSIPDCGGGRAPPKTTQPGCAGYTGTATLTPSYLSVSPTATATVKSTKSSPAELHATTSCADDMGPTYTAGAGGAQVLSLNIAGAGGAGAQVPSLSTAKAAVASAGSSSGHGGNATVTAAGSARTSLHVQAAGASGTGMAKGVVCVVVGLVVAIQAML